MSEDFILERMTEGCGVGVDYHVVSSLDYGVAATGDNGSSSAGRNGISASGRFGCSVTKDCGMSVAGFHGYAATGDGGIAIAIEGYVKGGLGAMLVSVREPRNEGTPLFRSALVDGKRIKPNVWYYWRKNRFVECGREFATIE